MNNFILPKFLLRLFVFVAFIAQAGFSSALNLAKDSPSGPVVLKVSGKIGLKNSADSAVFDEVMLDALPQKSFVTETPWTKGSVKFTGPLLSDVLKAVNASGSKLKAVALNDYKVNIPMEDVNKYGIILARKMDGKVMSIRDKGPLFVMYPFDKFPEVRASIYYGRCIWQLQSIVVE